MPRDKRKQADHQADTRGQGWIGLPRTVADSAAYLSLDPFQRAVFGEILGRFNGFNNGDIAMSFEEIGERIKASNKCRPNNARTTAAIVALMERGLIAEPTPESWMQRRARTYRLTFITSGKAPPYRRATNEYLSWKPEKKNDGDAGSPEKRPSGDVQSPSHRDAGYGRSPESAKNGSFALPDRPSPGDAGSPLIDKPYHHRKSAAGISLNSIPENAGGPSAAGAAR